MNEFKNMESCFLCGRNFQFGPSRYDGSFIPKYQFIVCQYCYLTAWDGWGPAWEPKILEHLEKNGLEVPTRDKDGLLPRN